MPARSLLRPYNAPLFWSLAVYTEFMTTARTQIVDEQLNALAMYLRERREAMLHAWRTAADGDPHLTTANALPHTQFIDHIPDLLDAFERRLQAWPQEPPRFDQEEQKKDAATHGLQRWHQGYRLREVTREWGHFQLALIDEVERYANIRPNASADALPIARRAFVEFCSSSVGESIAEYFRLEQIEASGHVRDLARTLKEEREFEHERMELWRQGVHDLRGQVGTVVNATAGLTSGAVAEPVREKFLLLLQRSTASLHGMLDEVMSLARLQAGQERLEVKPFDAGQELRELCEELHAQADARGLYLDSDGPASLRVEGDAGKTRRIAQNLLINALRYTQAGGVTVRWGDSRENDHGRWMFSVQDTGPGFHAGPGAPLVSALKAATVASHDIDRKAGIDPQAAEPEASALDTDRRAVNQESGEGIGLSIVKRLGDLMNATIELESSAESGTIFRVILPRRYQRPEEAT